MHELIVSVKLALKNLSSNLGRTLLSLLGIVIGVMSVVLVMSLGAGVERFVMDQVESFGTDLIEIEVKTPQTKHASAENASSQAGGTQITTLKLKELEDLSKIPNLGDWYAGMMSQQNVNYREKNKQTYLMGTTAGIWEVDEQAKLAAGRGYTERECEGAQMVAVIGSEIKDEFFPNKEAIGETLKIKKLPFKVIGVLEPRGSNGFFSFDEMIYVPLQTLQKRVMGVDYTQFALYKLEDPAKTELTEQEMNDLMRDKHDIDDPNDDDFGVMSIAEASKMVEDVFSVVQILLLALTSISLVVGGVGIMNVMYVSVAERTFEIGLKKSLGATSADILKQFLFEAIFLTLWGCLLGLILGVVLSQISAVIIARLGFNLSFPINSSMILLSFGFSAVVGLVFGLSPAYKASRLTPMEALGEKG